MPVVHPQWRLEVGKVPFNLRSGLDDLAWQFVKLDGREPGGSTQSPIRKTPFNEEGERIAPDIDPGIKSVQILQALEEVQPYYGPEGTIEGGEGSPLWHVHRLNIIDEPDCFW